ncbi:MAG: hypothetical protein ABL970_03720 [Nitrospira sp.]
MRSTSWAMGVVVLAVLATGCGTANQSGMASTDKEYMPPTSIYNVLDSTALVYSDPTAGSPINDNPVRWLGFLFHPLGHALDYAVNRPIYTLAGAFPYFFGYTSEDNMLDAQRR